MNYCIAACDYFKKVNDPSNNPKHTCFQATAGFVERSDLKRIMEDPNFLFIRNNVVYFKS